MQGDVGEIYREIYVLLIAVLRRKAIRVRVRVRVRLGSGSDLGVRVRVSPPCAGAPRS